MAAKGAPWLAEVLRDAGLTVVEADGWQEHGRKTFTPKGVLLHHTVTGTNWSQERLTDFLVKGRSDLRGPLCNLQLERDGTFVVISGQRANHAGAGKWGRITNGGNNFIGIEMANDGRSEPWPSAQLEAMERACVALMSHMGSADDMLIAHREWAPGRKVDPHSIDMDMLRDRVSAIRAGARLPKPDAVASKPKPTAPSSVDTTPTLRRGAKGAAVKTVQRHLNRLIQANLSVDGDFGPRTDHAVRRWQAQEGLEPDGIVGPITWKSFTDEPQPIRPTPASPRPAAPAAARPTPEPFFVNRQFKPLPTTRLLKLGRRGYPVTTLQKELVAQAGANITVDGIFGPQTLAAVQRWQRRKNLVVDGIVGPKTWETLGYKN